MCGTRFTFQFTSSVETCGKESALLRVAKALFDGERNEFQKVMKNWRCTALTLIQVDAKTNSIILHFV